jgi:hypothetical protein
MKKMSEPMPTVEYRGSVYKLRSRKIVVPALALMDDLSALIWINRNTTPRGYQKAPNPLKGMGGAITIK